jgi:hypothetical protein
MKCILESDMKGSRMQWYSEKQYFARLIYIRIFNTKADVPVVSVIPDFARLSSREA